MSDKIHPLDAIRALEESSALKACIEALEREVKEARQRAVDNGKWLGELLAVIHRDGGHYQALHGDEKSLEDAIAIVHAAEAREARLSKALRKAAGALDEASEEVAGWGAYAGDYFQSKHDLAGCVDHVRNEAATARAALSGSGSGWPVPAGWKLVPVEPDDAMIEAGQDTCEEKNCWGGRVYASDIWESMLAASPAAPQQGGE